MGLLFGILVSKDYFSTFWTSLFEDFRLDKLLIPLASIFIMIGKSCVQDLKKCLQLDADFVLDQFLIQGRPKRALNWFICTYFLDLVLVWSHYHGTLEDCIRWPNPHPPSTSPLLFLSANVESELKILYFDYLHKALRMARFLLHINRAMYSSLSWD